MANSSTDWANNINHLPFIIFHFSFFTYFTLRKKQRKGFFPHIAWVHMFKKKNKPFIFFDRKGRFLEWKTRAQGARIHYKLLSVNYSTLQCSGAITYTSRPTRTTFKRLSKTAMLAFWKRALFRRVMQGRAKKSIFRVFSLFFSYFSNILPGILKMWELELSSNPGTKNNNKNYWHWFK